MARHPDFFIVGAPKAGTTSLHHYLRQHPQVFMPAVKELNYFGSDRALRHTPRMSRDEYLSLFADVPDGIARVGEASVSYLRSNLAATEIAAFAPGAQAIVMLRDPVEMMHALHAELVFLGVEDLDFGEAVAAEGDRREGRRIPPKVNNPRAVLYREAATFSEQLERYFDALGRDHVHVIIFDDFRADTAASVRDTFRFLGVDSTFQPTLEVVNPAKVPRLKAVQNLLSSPPSWLRRAVRSVMPRPTRKRLYRGVSRLNARAQAREPMDPQLRSALVAEFGPEIERLERLLGRDLSAWKRA